MGITTISQLNYSSSTVGV